MVYYGEVWLHKKGKMLDPSGCFFDAVPEKCGTCGARIGLKIACLVTNTIASKLYFETPLKLHTHKSCAGVLVIDHHYKVAK